MLIFFLKSKTKTWEHNFGDAVAMEFISRERVSDFSLEIHVRWISTGQEGKLFYAEQATRGPWVCEFLTTPRGRIFSLLVFYSHF